MGRKVVTNLEITYRFNGKEEPERLNRVYDMVFEMILKEVNPTDENGKPKDIKTIV